jgi:hypothetical protein
MTLVLVEVSGGVPEVSTHGLHVEILTIEWDNLREKIPAVAVLEAQQHIIDLKIFSPTDDQVIPEVIERLEEFIAEQLEWLEEQ